ncbi:Uncharacterised protein [uncultured archaeon]|nr:Uncharacterised protein [uncultured archaeon]
MNIKELNDLLDIKVAAAITECKEAYGEGDSITFKGSVAGFLIKTGIYLAAEGGCPNKILRNQLNEAIKEAYHQ